MAEFEPLESPGVEPDDDQRSKGLAPLWTFIGIVLGLAAVKVLVGFLRLEGAALAIANGLITVLFVGAPVAALYGASRIRWTAKLGLAFIAVGVVLHSGLQYLGGQLVTISPLGAATLLALRDLGMLGWCVGLGATLATLLRDKNLLIPVSIFLAGFDIFLVLTPVGPVKLILKTMPQVPQAMALNLPSAAGHAAGAPPAAFAFIGPADFVFMGMFFIALYRFGMNVKTTAIWLAPAILAYLGLSLIFGAIPLLVPIGLTVLIVNWKQFRLNGEEWASTALIAALVGGAIWWGATRKAPPAAPLQPGDAPRIQVSEGSPEQAPANPPR